MRLAYACTSSCLVQCLFLFIQFGRFATTSELGLCNDCVPLTSDSLRFCIIFRHYFLVLRSGKFWTSQTSLLCIKPWSIPGIDEGEAFTPSSLPLFWVYDSHFRLYNISGGSEAGREGSRLFFLYVILHSPDKRCMVVRYNEAIDMDNKSVTPNSRHDEAVTCILSWRLRCKPSPTHLL